MRRAAALWPIAVPVFALLLFLPLLDLRPLRFEEGRRALQAIALLQGESWWRLEVLGEPYISKPPLLPWLIAVVGALLGEVNGWAVRLPAVLAAAGGALAAAAMARFAAEREAQISALAAGVYFLGSGFVLTKARVGETDLLVTTLAGCAFLAWAGFRRGNHVDLRGWILVGLCFALAAFAKGPIPILFPLVPMIVVPVLDRSWRDLVALAATLAVALISLAAWLYLNRDVMDAAHVLAETRLKPSGFLSEISWDEPLAALASMLPGAALAALWVLARPAPLTAAGQRLPLALVLYALPVALIVLFWPHSNSRYAMPALWPVAVMAGLVTGWFWHQTRAAARTLLATAMIAAAFALVTLFALDGRTPGQRAALAKAEALESALVGVPAGRLLLLWEDGSPDHNALAYAGRPLTRVDGEDLSEPRAAAALLAEAAAAEAVERSGRWRLQERVGDDWLILYRPAER